MLKATIQEFMERAREAEARAAKASEADILHSRKSGIDARDVATLRAFSQRLSLLIVVRCPKATARAWHGLLPGKNIATKAKTGSSGVVVRKSGPQGKERTVMMVSDYDLMSVWKRDGASYEKVFISALEKGAPRGKWAPAAVKLVRALNRALVTKIMHGCQDDWHSPDNPGVKSEDRFAAFEREQFFYLQNPGACEAFYRSRGLDWPYDGAGKMVLRGG